MARRSGFSRSNSNTRSSNTTTAPRTAPPQAPPQTQSRPGIFGGLMGTMVQGMAFGAGSEVAHQAIRSVMGGNSHQQVEQQQQVNQNQVQSNPCMMENNNFVECLKFNSNNITSCQSYIDSLKECEDRFK